MNIDNATTKNELQFIADHAIFKPINQYTIENGEVHEL